MNKKPNENLPVTGCFGISAPFIPWDSNKLRTAEQLLSGFVAAAVAAAVASAPFTSFGVVADRAEFCASAPVNVCIANAANVTITANCRHCCVVSSRRRSIIFDRFVLDHIVYCRLDNSIRFDSIRYDVQMYTAIILLLLFY